MSFDINTWPVASLDGQKLYVNVVLDQDAVEVLRAKGWALVDVRALPNETDADRAASLRCWLEGIRLGTIAANSMLYDFIKLEAQTLGVLNTKTPNAVKPQKDELDPLEALNFTSSRAFKGTYLQNLQGNPRPQGGRPRGVKDEVSRKPRGGSNASSGKPPKLRALPNPSASGNTEDREQGS